MQGVWQNHSFRPASSKWYKLGPHLLWNANRNSPMQSIEWWYFQWSWVTSNPDFKVRPLFRAEYLRNDTRYRHSYNRMLIGTYTRPIQGCDFQWRWVTLSNLVKYIQWWSIMQPWLLQQCSCWYHWSTTIKAASDLECCHSSYCWNQKIMTCTWRQSYAISIGYRFIIR